MARPLLIGQAPGPNTDPRMSLYPLPKNSAGWRLKEQMGLSMGRYLRTFDRMNLIVEFTGRYAKEDRFPTVQARATADSVKQLLWGRQVIVLGRQVAIAFRHRPQFFEWRQYEETVYPERSYNMVVIPHTSGLSRWYNVRENTSRSREFWDIYFDRDRGTVVVNN